MKTMKELGIKVHVNFLPMIKCLFREEFLMKYSVKMVFLSALFFLLFIHINSLAQQPELVVQAGFSGNISGMAISPDEKYILVATIDKKVKLFDLDKRVELASITTSDIIYKMIFTDDPGKIIMISTWGYVYYLDLLRDKGRCKLLLRTDKYIRNKYFPNTYEDLFNVTFADHARLIITCRSNQIYFIDSRTLEVLDEIDGNLPKSDVTGNKIVYLAENKKYIVIDSFSFVSDKFSRINLRKINVNSLLNNFTDQTGISAELFKIATLKFDRQEENLQLLLTYNQTVSYSDYDTSLNEITQLERTSEAYIFQFNLSDLLNISSHSAIDYDVLLKNIRYQMISYYSDFPLTNFFTFKELHKILLWYSSGKVELAELTDNTDTEFYSEYVDIHNNVTIYEPGLKTKTFYYYSTGIFAHDIDDGKRTILNFALANYLLAKDFQFYIPTAESGLNYFSVNDSLQVHAFIEKRISESKIPNIYNLSVGFEPDEIVFSGLTNTLNLIDIENGKVSTYAFPDSIIIIRNFFRQAEKEIWVLAISKARMDSLILTETEKSEDLEVYLENEVSSSLVLYKLSIVADGFSEKIVFNTSVGFNPKILLATSMNDDEFYLFEDSLISFGLSGEFSYVVSVANDSYIVNQLDKAEKYPKYSRQSSGSRIISDRKKIAGNNNTGSFEFKSPSNEILSTAFNEKGDLIVLYRSGSLYVQNMHSGEILSRFTTCDIGVPQYTYDLYKNAKYIVIGSSNGLIVLWDYLLKKEVFRFYLLPDHSWVLISSDGLFDSKGEVDDYLKFIIADSLKPENRWKIINLKDLKHRYYQPNLFRIALGSSDENLRNVASFQAVEFAPEITVERNNKLFVITLSDQGGGFGKVSLYLDGIELRENLLSPEIQVTGSRIELRIDLDSFEKWIKPNAVNHIKIIAFNKGNWLSNESEIIDYQPIPTKGAAPSGHEIRVETIPELYAIVCGISDYTGRAIDLQYASKDAEDFAKSLQYAANELFGEDHVHVFVLSSQQTGENLPTRANLMRLFDSVSHTSADDIVVVYLSGHGVNFGGQDGDFYYLTQEASGADASYLNDNYVRDNFTISSREMIEKMNEIPARKKLIILDACASGKAAEILISASRDVPASQIRALDRLKDRTGFYVLAGSASDAVSYETSIYGQGLLTYSLLKAMKGAALRLDGAEEYIDVQTLFQYAVEEVPLLAKEIGGIQMPLFRSPSDQRSFDIGKVNPEIKEKIEIAQPKPVFTESRFVSSEELYDVYNLSSGVNAQLMELNSKGKNAPILYVQSLNYPGSYQISGTYSVYNNVVSVSFIIRKDHVKIGETLMAESDVNKMDGLIRQIIEKAQDLITR